MLCQQTHTKHIQIITYGHSRTILESQNDGLMDDNFVFHLDWCAERATQSNCCSAKLSTFFLLNHGPTNSGYWTTRGCHRRLCVLSFPSFGCICETASCPVTPTAQSFTSLITRFKGVFHCAENRQSPSRFFFGKWVELMNICVARVLCMT